MRVGLVLLTVTIAAGFNAPSVARPYSVLYDFASGETPGISELLRNHSGTLIGPESGFPGEYIGALFRVSEKGGAWHGHTLHVFTGGDGANPQGGLVRDTSDVYYGTAPYQGKYSCGTIYSLARPNGDWRVSVLYNFTGGMDGCHPTGTLLLDGKTGTLYGTASAGGPAFGNVFALQLRNGQWALKILYNFGANNNFNDGLNPQDGVRFGTNGNTLFGVTPYGGGEADCGTVFMLKNSGGNWSETVLHKFTGISDGSYPQDIDVDASGNIFGVAPDGGANAEGTAFELSEGVFNVLHNFGQTTSDGYSPRGLRIERSTDNIFGVTSSGGELSGGTVFKLTNSAGAWTESVLHSFGNDSGGYYPEARPTEDENMGHLFGTTASGGKNSGGTVWMLSL